MPGSPSITPSRTDITCGSSWLRENRLEPHSEQKSLAKPPSGGTHAFTSSSPESKEFHAIPTRTRVLVAVVYLGLAALLAVGVAETFLERSFSDV